MKLNSKIIAKQQKRFVVFIPTQLASFLVGNVAN